MDNSPSSHTSRLFLSLPEPHHHPFSTSSNSAVTPTKLKVKETC